MKKWTITYTCNGTHIFEVDKLSDAVEPMKLVCPLIKSVRTLEGIVHKENNNYRDFIKITQNYKKKTVTKI